tara:strand:- start:104 stop:652 length:549 start_codon:yes stop_codon:yes gene_type:complete
MKIIFSFIIIFLVFSCSNNKEVYWCGDHACINKKEKEAYFKENMIVEKKVLDKNKKLSKKRKDEILRQIREKEKKFSKKEKLERRQAKLEEKQISKKEKNISDLTEVAKQKECFDWKVENRSLRECLNPILGSREKKLEKVAVKEVVLVDSGQNISDFEKLAEKISLRNKSKPYPDINDIPD